MRKKIFATCVVAIVLGVFTGCSEDDIIADNEIQNTTQQLNDRESESARRNQSKYIATPITGTVNGITFTGDYRITEFVVKNDVLYAVGTLTNISGVGLPAGVADLAGKQILLPVNREASGAGAAATTAAAGAAAIGSCDILFLQLGPLDLDLLGLQIHLDQVLLNIDAATGAGNLLGNLLCAVTGLLDGVGSLVAIAQLLNQIISIIGTLG